MNSSLFSFSFMAVRLGLVALLTWTSNSMKADQLAYLSKADAEAAVSYFNVIDKTVLLACYCCDDPEEEWLTYTSARIEDTGVKSRKGPGNYFEVVLSNRQVTRKVDLAYVHVDILGRRICVGDVLNMNCDPCSAPSIVRKYRVTSGSMDGDDITTGLLESGAHLELVQRGGTWFMNNVWIHSGTHSAGPIHNIESEDIPATAENDAMTHLKFQWSYANSYDDRTGTCDVQFWIVPKPDETAVVVDIITDQGSTLKYTATQDGQLVY